MSNPTTKSALRRGILGTASTIAAVSLLAACGQAPTDPTTSGSTDGGTNTAATEDFKACMVSDSGGFDDHSFNELSFKGLTDGAAANGIQHAEVESQDDTVYVSNLESLVAQNCNIIFSVGFLLKDATETVAKANPDVHFAIIDDNQITADNVKPLVYDTAEAAFLAGYVAASYSESGKVATWGGMNIPTVTVFMDGFAEGVKYYNEQNGTKVEVLGWDVEKQDGSFTGGFEANPEAKSIAEQFISQGADVLMPVGGPIYQPAAEAVRDAHKDGKEHVALVGVDTDLTVTDEKYKDIILTSVLKGMDVSVSDTITESVNGSFAAEPYVGTLENGGVSLAPFHDFEGKVKPELQTEIDELIQKIISGEVKVESPSSPKK